MFLSLAVRIEILPDGGRMSVARSGARKAAFETMTDQQLPVCFNVVKLVKKVGIRNFHKPTKNIMLIRVPQAP